MTVRILAAFAVLAVAATDGTAGERSACRQADADNPMVSSADYGVATCHMQRAPRYHRDDYAQPSYEIASGDPMVWDQDQWRGNLMGYSHARDDGYDRRFRRDAGEADASGATVVEIEIKHTIESETAAAPAAKRGPRLTVGGVNQTWMRAHPRVDRDRLDRTRCPNGGPKILMWDGGRSVDVCPATGSWRGRLAPSSRDSSAADRG